jgi:lysophospholipase L1-like esterase
MKTRILVIILANAAILVAMGVVGFNLLRGIYAQNHLQRLDPLNLSFFPLEALPTPSAGSTRLVMFGDSRAVAWPDPAIANLDIIKRGIGSQTAAQVALRFQYHVAPLQPDVILVQVCINDLKVIPLIPDQYAAIVAGCINHVQEIIDAARAINAKVILTTVFPVGTVPFERQAVWSDAVAQAVREVNAAFATMTADDVILFDAFAILIGDDDLIQPRYADDELHLNASGYIALNESLVPLLNQLIP